MNPGRFVSRTVTPALGLCLIIAVLTSTSAVGPSHASGSRAVRCPQGKVLRDGACVYGTSAARVIAIVREQMALHHLKAVIFEVRIGKKTLVSTALGQSLTGVPATTHMHFRIGSVAIAYLTTLLLELVDRGVVRLDDPVGKWLPNLPRARLVTLRMLANSGSGYPDYVPLPAFQKALEADPFKHWTQQELLRIAMAQPLRNAPGAKFNYAHTNYVILGAALEKATGRPVASLLRQNVLNPLGLRNTDSVSTPQIRPPVLHAFTSERGRYEESTFWDPSWTLATGTIMTSDIEDMTRSAIAIGTGSLLSPRSHREQVARAYVVSPPGSPKLYYGLGVLEQGGWIAQNPSFGGYSGVMAYLPAKQIAIAISSTKGKKADPTASYSTAIFTALSKYLAPAYSGR